MRRDGGPAFLPLILLLFIGSGCSALIYEIVWFQLLEFSVGSSAVSLGVLLGTFMGGLCIGSLLFNRMVPAKWHPLRVYATLELGIGILGLVLTLALPTLESVYASIAHNNPSILLRAVMCVVILLPPTILMGATLPAISRWIESTPRGLAWLGFFYGGNTFGAVVGCLLAGFVLLRLYDMNVSAYLAAGINLAVALIGLLLSTMTGPVAAHSDAPAAGPALVPVRDASDSLPRGLIYVSIAVSGMTALGAEVVWTRILSLLLGGTTYTFSIILAVFLAGLGIGSSIGAMFTRTAANPRVALAWCQGLCALGIGWTAYNITTALPQWPVSPWITMSPGYRFQLDLARCAWAILPPTVFWGASFPIALAALAGGASKQETARTVGRVYAANTVGAICGALFFSLFAVVTWGTQVCERTLIVLAAVAGILAALSAVAQAVSALTREMAQGIARRFEGSLLFNGLTALVATLLIAGGTLFILARNELDKTPWELVAYGRDILNSRRNFPYRQLVEMREGRSSSVAVTREGFDTLFFHVAGKVEASTLPEDMRLQLMLGHFPSMFHPAPKKVLIVGCGAGVTAGSFLLHLPPYDPAHPDDVKVVICEIEPLVPNVVATHFSAQNNGVVTRKQNGEFLDPRVKVVYDDARHYILTTDEKFDIITSDPIHPWVKGAASLYTKEYFELVKQHLNPGGLVTQWVPLYESNMAVVKSEVKTFFEAFPNGSVWSNDINGGGYDVVLMGGAEPLKIDAAALQKRLDNILVKSTLSKVNLGTATDVLKTYSGSAEDLKSWTIDGETNHDANLRLQYLAGEANNEDRASDILGAMTRLRTYPAAMLTVTPAQRADLEQTWAGWSPLIKPTPVEAPASRPLP